MWRGGIIAAAAALLCGNLATPLPAAQPPGEAANAAANDAPDAAARLAEDRLTTARQAFTLVESWAHQGRTPAETIAIRAKRVAAVCVTLRLQGARLGRGVAVVDNPRRRAAAADPSDISPLLRAAAADALDEAADALPRITGKIDGKPIPDRLDGVAPALQLDLQLAGPPQRLRLAKLSQMPSQFTVGHHGLAASHDQRWGLLFPATAIDANLSLPGQVQRVLASVNLPPDAMARIGEADGPTLYRFDATHLVRLAPGEAPTELRRGQRPLPPQPFNLHATQRYADFWARRIVQWQRDDGLFPGSYEPSADRFDPEVADPVDAALACFALGRYSRMARLDDGEAGGPDAAAAARRGLAALVKDLGYDPDDPRRAPRDAGRFSIAAAAMIVAAIVETPETGSLKSVRDALGELVLSARQPDGGFRSAARAGAPEVSAAEQALIGYAMVRLYDQTRREACLEAGRGALIDAWRKGEGGVALLPWAALAEFDLRRLGKATPGLLALRKTCQTVRDRQITAPARRGAEPLTADAVGGFRLPAGLIDEPTWHSARPLIALAAALPHERFVGREDQNRWLVDTALGVRFLAQLTMTRDAAWYVRRPSRAVGGVRAAFWDNRQSPPATALALLAAVEFERGVIQLARQRRDANDANDANDRGDADPAEDRGRADDREQPDRRPRADDRPADLR